MKLNGVEVKINNDGKFSYLYQKKKDADVSVGNLGSSTLIFLVSLINGIVFIPANNKMKLKTKGSKTMQDYVKNIVFNNCYLDISHIDAKLDEIDVGKLFEIAEQWKSQYLCQATYLIEVMQLNKHRIEIITHDLKPYYNILNNLPRFFEAFGDEMYEEHIYKYNNDCLLDLLDNTHISQKLIEKITKELNRRRCKIVRSQNLFDVEKVVINPNEFVDNIGKFWDEYYFTYGSHMELPSLCRNDYLGEFLFRMKKDIFEPYVCCMVDNQRIDPRHIVDYVPRRKVYLHPELD